MKNLLKIVAFVMLASYLWGQGTANNTSACSANGAPTAGCNGVGIMPFLTNGANTGVQTSTVDPLPVSSSTAPVSNYAYSGSTAKWVAEYQPWFYNVTPYNGHKNIGMNESLAAQVLAQAQWMKTVGFESTVVDWYGCADYCDTPQSSAQHYNNQVTLALASAISSNSSTTPKFFIMIDGGAIDGSGTGQCPAAAGDQSTCLIAAINLQMDYVARNWLGQSYYETDRNGRPMVLFFVNQPSWPGTNFSTVYAAVATHATSGNSCGSSCTYPATVDLIDENAGAFSESGVSGGYAWPQPNAYSSTNQFDWQGSGGFDYLADFYSHARAASSKIAIGVVYKGFDDNNASWGSDRVIAQQCGQLLSLTANKIGAAGYNSSSQIDYIQVATWNDYEEATEVETGVNNCLTVNQPTVSGGTIHWSVAKSDATYGTTSTISKYQIWTGVSAPTSLLVDNIASSATSNALSGVPSGQSAWVYAVGQPLVQNQQSPPVTPCSGTGTCYYIASNGSDSNNGLSKLSPWLHAPYMHSWTGSSYTHAAGDHFIFRGGDTWGPSDYFVIPNGGSGSSTPDYYGVDKTWFSGSSWNRPILAMAGSLPNQIAESPGFESVILQIEAPWITFDNFEVTGMTCTSTVSGNFIFPTGGIYDGIKVTNSYFHAFQSPSSLCPVSTKLGDGQNAAVWLFTQIGSDTTKCHGAFSYNVVDGTDGTGNKGYQTVVADPAPCITVDHNVIHDVCSGVGGYFSSVDDNAIYNFGGQIGQFECASSPGLHNHAVRSNGDLSAGTVVANNQIYATEAEAIEINPGTGTTSIYNNVLWNNNASAINICDNGGGCSAGTAVIANNTLVNSGQLAVQNRQAVNVLTLANNFDICTTATFAGCYVGTNLATTLNTPGGETYLTPSQATTDGYTSSQTYPFSPTYTSSPTVGAGNTGIFSAETSATTRGCYQGTVSGVVQAVCPTIAAATRASSGTCTPGTAGCVDSGADMFVPTTTSYTLTIGQAGSGTIANTFNANLCVNGSGAGCSITAPSGTAITLTATPATNYTFIGWAYSGCSFGGGASSTCTTTLTAATTVAAIFAESQPQQPAVWVDNNELTCKLPGQSCAAGSPGLSLTAPAYEIILGSGWVGSAPPGCTFTNAPYTATFGNAYTSSACPAAASRTGLQGALCDIEACRTATGAGIILDVPPATYTATSIYGLVLPQTNTVPATAPIIVRSTMDGDLPNGQVPCTHGIGDNIPEETYVGLNNPGCDAQNMYYLLGPAITSGVISGWTTLSVNTHVLCPIPNSTATLLCPVTTLGTQQLIPLANGYISPGITVTLDVAGPNQESLVTATGANQIGMLITPQISHTTGCTLVRSTWTGCTVPVQMCVAGCPYTLAGTTGGVLVNGAWVGGTNAINTSSYNDKAYMFNVVAAPTGGTAIQTCNASATTTSPTCATNIGPDHIELESFSASQSVGNGNDNANISIVGVLLDTVTSQLASHIHLRKFFDYGDYTSLYTGANSIINGVAFQPLYGSVGDFYISQIMRPGAEGHGITIDGNQLKIYDGWIDGGSIPLFAGGFSNGSGPTLSNWIPATDVEVKNVMMSYPFSWLGLSPVAAGTNPNWTNAFSTVGKNRGELKGANRIVFIANIHQNSDNSGGQRGVLGEWGARNNSAGNGTYYNATVKDATSYGEIFRHGCYGFDVNTDGGGVDYPPRNIAFVNPLFYDVSQANYAGCPQVGGLNLAPGGGNWQGTVTIGADGKTGTFVAACSDDLGQCVGQVSSIFISGGTCPVGGGNGTFTLSTPNLAGGNQAAGWSWQCGFSTALSESGTTVTATSTLNPGVGNLIWVTAASPSGYNCSACAVTVSNSTSFQYAATSSGLGAGTTSTIYGVNAGSIYGSGYTSATATASGTGAPTSITVNLNASSSGISTAIGYQAFDVTPGNPIAVTQCQNSAFNTVGSTLHGGTTYYPSAAGPPAITASVPWNGTFQSGNVTTTFPLTGTASTSETSGYCKLTTHQGSPYSFDWNHGTFVSAQTYTLTSGVGFNNTQTDGPMYGQLESFRNSLFGNGELGSSSYGLGTAASQLYFDTLSTFTLSGIAWPGQTAASYTAYGLNPVFPVGSPAMYFPSTTCGWGMNGTGSWAYGTCSGNAVPINAADYHVFQLNPSSTYYSSASDGKPLGVPSILTNITQLHHLNQWTCTAPCGSPGPFQDTLPGLNVASPVSIRFW